MRKIILLMVATLIVACDDDTPLQPLSALPHATATPSCGPADGPATAIYLASTPVQLPQPDVPFIQVFVPRRFTESTTEGVVFRIGENFDEEASAWFHRSGVELKSATSGEVGITAFTGNLLTGYVDLEFPDGVRVRGSFSASWQHREILCG